jgi:hypothetical protein
MSRAPLVFSAAAVLFASSFIALADQSSAISSAAALSETASVQKSAEKKQEHEYRLLWRYRGYEEAPSAMNVPFRRT